MTIKTTNDLEREHVESVLTSYADLTIWLGASETTARAQLAASAAQMGVQS